MFLALACMAACGSLGSDVKTQSLGNGEFRLVCKVSLATCLREADRLCMGNRFEVRSAKDDRDYYGPATIAETEIRTSEAVIWCGQRGRNLSAHAGAGEAEASRPLVASPADQPGPGPAPLRSAPTPVSTATFRVRVCVPGATQTCVGPAACPGGQTCLPDATGFAGCDCGAERQLPQKLGP